MSTHALSLLRVVGLALLLYAVLMFAFQRRLVFPGVSRGSLRGEPLAPPDATQVWLDTSFGRTEAWLFRVGGAASAPTIIFAHGNGEIIEDWVEEMRMLRDAGMNVLLVEFPGYGHSEGRPTRTSLREAFSAAFDWLVDVGEVDPRRIVAYGRSIGGGAASDLSRDRPVGALVLQSTFSSAAAMAREAFLPGFLVLDRFDNGAAVAGFSGPVLLMHGPEDEVIEYAHAERLAALRSGLEITQLDCGHNDCARAWPAIVSSVGSFLETHGMLDVQPARDTG